MPLPKRLKIEGKYLFWLIIGVAFLVRLLPILGNHFYFTIDQGRDAIAARDILHGHFPLVGAETDIHGVYHGVGWFYLLAILSLFGNGSPAAPVLFFIVLNVVVIGWVMKILRPRFGLITALAAGGLLAIYLPFYETSRYAFNPFLLPALGLLFVHGATIHQRRPLLATILMGTAVGLSLHSQLAAIGPFVITYFLLNMSWIMRRKFDWGNSFLGLILIFLLFFPHIFSELITNLAQWKSLHQHINSDQSIFAASFSHNLIATTSTYLIMIGETLVPQLPLFGVGIFLILIIYTIYRKKSLADWIKYTYLLLGVSWLWFSTNSGYRSWLNLYLPPLLLISTVIATQVLPRRWRLGLLASILILQSLNLFSTLRDYTFDRIDDGLLANQLAAIDWIYQRRENENFRVMTYVPSINGYHYQYLFPWYSQRKRLPLPCQSRDCSQLIFLILEAPVNPQDQTEWHEGVSQNTELIDQTTIGELKLEKRKL